MDIDNDYLEVNLPSYLKEAKSVVMTLRLDRAIQEEFDKLAAQSDRSRNELMCMALRYALEHLEFIPE